MTQLRPFQLRLPFFVSLSLAIGLSGCGPTQRTSSKPDGPVVSKLPSSSEPASDDSSGPSSDQDVLAALAAKGAIVKKDDGGNVVSVALIGPDSSTVTDADLDELPVRRTYK